MSRRRVVIAEDEGLTALRLRSSLARFGYEVVGVARNGEEVVEVALRLGPDAVVMDIEMPHLDGIAATRQIMAVRPTAILMLSAYSERETVDAALAAGACGYLVKPTGDDEIESALAAALARFTAQNSECGPHP